MGNLKLLLISTVADFKFWGICLVNMSVRMVVLPVAASFDKGIQA